MQKIIIAPNWLRFLIIFLLVVGILFRLGNLDKKIYSYDEVDVSLRISGYTAAEVRQEIFNGRVLTRQALTKFQGVNREKNIFYTVKSVAIENPQHPPLYYIIARIWVQFFGNSITAIRSLSCLISLLIFPCIYWLCRELLRVPLSFPWLAIALLSISPFNLIYAQDAQDTMLWLLMAILTSTSLLRAISRKNISKTNENQQKNWIIYGVCLLISLYTSWQAFIMAIAHSLYIFIINQYRWNKITKLYTISVSAALLGFLPWLFITLGDLLRFKLFTASIQNSPQITDFPFLNLWNFSRFVFDGGMVFSNILGWCMAMIIISLMGYSLYFLYRTTHISVWLFVFTLIFVPIIITIPLSLLAKGKIFFWDEYFITTYLGILISLAYLVATQLYSGTFIRQNLWQVIFIFLLICSFISCLTISQADTWWHKNFSYGNMQIARIVNRANRPLVISDYQGINFGNVLALSRELEDTVSFQLISNRRIPKLSTNFDSIFLMNLDKTLLANIEKRYLVTSSLIYKDRFYLVYKLGRIRTSQR
ncbi:glycosyltransferase family 39 protein [Calothrix sp. 336/3]|uniref:glycosyltransferase family 39 protein n=1 Tax=Calothrix sp. 336/3 TaxID=1337936 RepID=UPI0004E3DD2C|nr:glycosyltransferase family 39 protein [Calothrix sp. 336/3]AKG22872.1 hypothetical protein IJ00_17735 [Calothrix sp. 336/3]